jgi:hypothetical protein
MHGCPVALICLQHSIILQQIIPDNATNWQMGFNLALKGLMSAVHHVGTFIMYFLQLKVFQTEAVDSNEPQI